MSQGLPALLFLRQRTPSVKVGEVRVVGVHNCALPARAALAAADQARDIKGAPGAFRALWTEGPL